MSYHKHCRPLRSKKHGERNVAPTFDDYAKYVVGDKVLPVALSPLWSLSYGESAWNLSFSSEMVRYRGNGRLLVVGP